ncbi:hypothetical protein HanPSC8_Chr16g0737111 [Helianthus annuus]|nr:hypothetical protein HanPSC8_Chr16g0737111 [Helianthus annuus]
MFYRSICLLMYTMFYVHFVFYIIPIEHKRNPKSASEIKVMLSLPCSNDCRHTLIIATSPSISYVWLLASCCQKMNFFCRSMADESAPSQHDIVRCPFLRNINEPTNFSFSSSMAFPLPARGTKGPIFEDGPNFDMAFRLFHGQNGVVSLSEGTLQFPQKVKPGQVSQQFNPLAAKAATISLSSLGGSFGFDAFNEMFKNHQKKNKKKSSQKGDSNHEATGEEWLKSGNCPIAKSYRVLCWLSSSASTSCRCLIPLKASLFFE